MQTIGGAVVTNIGDDAAGAQALAERLEIGALMSEAAFARGQKKVGARCQHGYTTDGVMRGTVRKQTLTMLT